MSREKVLAIDASYERMGDAVSKAFEGLGLDGLLTEVRGRRVFIKPNMLGGYGAEHHVCTHPSLVREVVRMFSEAGAEVAVGDNPGIGGYGMNERVARKSGIMDAAGSSFHNAGSDAVQVPVKSRFFSEMVVSRQMLEADFLINLPKMKTHSLTIVTACIKNMFGILVGGCKSQVHAAACDPVEFGEALVDIYRIRAPDLNIVDAVVAMEGNGPNAGKPRNAGKLIVSRNGVAADMVVAGMMRLDPLKIHHIRLAAERGLGPASLDEVDLQGEAGPLKRFRLPVSFPASEFLRSRFNRYFYRPLSRSRLRLDKDKCTGCGICVEHCPTHAMQKNEFPFIDEEKCIRCFCCFELCEENAWNIEGLLGRIRRGR